MATLSPTEDEIDDILYYSRTNCLSELKELLDSLSARSPLAMILTYAIDTLSGNSALHMSAANGHIEPTQYILSHSPSLSTKQNLSGSTPLHYAALNGHLDTVKLLVDIGGADVGTRNGAGRTALDDAENAGHAEVGGWLAGKTKDGEDSQAADGGDGGDNRDAAEEEGLETVNGRLTEDEVGQEGRGGVGEEEEEEEEEVRQGLDGLRIGGEEEK